MPEEISIADIARHHGIKPRSLWRRVNVAGMTIDEAINTPWRGGKLCSVNGCHERHEARGFCKKHYNQWYAHGDPLKRLRRTRGSGWYSNGYKLIGSRMEHINIAERAIGKSLPDGAVVHHANGNRLDNSSENLVICPSQTYHLLLHQRLNAYNSTGNPGFRKCTYCKQYDNPELMYVGKQVAWHRECRNSRIKKRGK